MDTRRDKCHFSPEEIDPNRDISMTYLCSVKPLVNGGVTAGTSVKPNNGKKAEERGKGSLVTEEQLVILPCFMHEPDECTFVREAYSLFLYLINFKKRITNKTFRALLDTGQQ